MKIFKQINKITTHDIYLGFRKAYDISLLPRRVELIYTSYVIRILRVIGGFCMVLVLTGKYSLFVKELHILIFIAALLQSILISIIFIIKFVYGLYIIIKKPEIFEVRNSPLNPFSTLLARALTCAKWGCQGIAGGTGILAGAVSYDTLLEASGREKIFMPFIARTFNDVFGEPMTTPA